MAIKEQDVVLVAKDTSGNKVIQMPITRVENVEGAIKTVNKVAPDASGNVAINTVANATKATQDASGNVITTTYATKTELSKKLDTTSAFTKAQADNLYLGKSAKAVSAGTADTATKATQDASGNVITSTYATKTELGNKLDKTAKATSAITADSVAWTGVTGRPDPIPKTGDTGTISVMETIATASTVSDTSARSMTLANGGSLSVSDGSGNKAWITVVALQGGATINLGSLWAWSGSAPTLAKGLVTLAWYGLFGVATFTKFGS